MLKIFTGTQLAVGHVDEVILSKYTAKLINIAPVNGVICTITAVNLVRDRYGSVCNNVKAKDKLPKIRTMILVYSESDVCGSRLEFLYRPWKVTVVVSW